MARHRQEFFLATKTGKRLYQDAREEIHRSLERLRVDSVDLIQLHALFHPDDWDLALGPGGALEAAIEARQQGLVRFIGVTGHGWTIAAMHKRSLERFDFDAILLPYNYVMHQNEHYREDFDTVVRLCEERQVAVQTIKAIARGPWPRARKRAIPGISPWKNRRTLTGPCTGSLAGLVFFSTPPEISSYCRRSWMLPAAMRHAQMTTPWRACWTSSA
jgi:aryl-alcohol dehydrogenase-like predicted oxidoreductase